MHLRSTSASREFRSRWPPSAGSPKGEDRLTIVWHGQTLLFPRVPPVWRARALRRPDGAVLDSVGLRRSDGKEAFRPEFRSKMAGGGVEWAVFEIARVVSRGGKDPVAQAHSGASWGY